MSHTPGPWTIEGVLDDDASGAGVWAESTQAYVCPPDDMRPEVTRIEDLRLIAEAPNLLALLKVASAELHGEFCADNDWRNCRHRIHGDMNVAIDRAEGRT